MKKLLLLLCCMAMQQMRLTAQPKGYAILIGVESTSAGGYPSLANAGIQNDIRSMRRICEQNNYITTVMQNTDAKLDSVVSKIKQIAAAIHDGDYFLFYFSGHGDIKADTNGDETIDGKDEVLVLSDRYLYDDKINELLSTYFKKTKNVMIVDACNSGTTYKYSFNILDYNSAETKYMLTAPNQFYISANKKNTATYNCSVEDKQEDNPYSLIYMGAAPDDKQAIATSKSSILTHYIETLMIKAKNIENWEDYDYRKFACEIGENMIKGGNQLQYHEIGNATNSYNHHVPFKLN